MQHSKRIPFPTTLAITAVTYTILGYLLSGEKPQTLSPSLTSLVLTLPHAIALVNTIALLSLFFGYRAIKSREISKHRILMTTAVVFITAFLIMYVTRIYLGGIKPFKGPEEIYRLIYLPALIIHIALSVLSVPLVTYNFLTGMILRIEEIPQTKHPRVGRIAVRLWSVSLTLGIAVYFMLNHIF